MFRRLSFILSSLALSLLISQPASARTLSLAERLSGRIVLQVQSHGEGWYIDPVSHQRFYLGTAQDAYALMRTKGLGMRHAELARYIVGRFPSRLSGRIILDVESHGEAYYVLPSTLRGIFLGRAEDAYRLMREYGLGITNADLARIPVSSNPPQLPINNQPTSSPSSPISPSTDLRSLEQRAFTQVNQHRSAIGLPNLTWNDTLAEIARTHSQNMANGSVAFGHDGFNNRFEEISRRIRPSYVGENVASNTYDDPASTAVKGWLNSPGHKANIENRLFQQSAMGVAEGPDKEYFFTQIFIGNP